MRRSRPPWIAAVVAAAALVAGCGGGESDEETAPAPPPGTASQPAEPGAEPPPATSEEPQVGGVYRVDWEASFNFTNGFDPTGEYLGEVWGIYSSLLVRTLVGYRHTAGAAGNELVPDLAGTGLGRASPATG